MVTEKLQHREGDTKMAETKKFKRVPTRVHTRELDRGIARERMRKAKLNRVGKGSFFADNWRKYGTD